MTHCSCWPYRFINNPTKNTWAQHTPARWCYQLMPWDNMTRKTENWTSKSHIELATSETGQAHSSALKSAADMCCCAFQVALKAGGSNLVDTAAGTWPIHSNNGRSYYFEIAYRTGVSTCKHHVDSWMPNQTNRENLKATSNDSKQHPAACGRWYLRFSLAIEVKWRW